MLLPDGDFVRPDADHAVSTDGSVLASGPNPGETIYTIEAVTSLPRVTAVRLEALPDPSLPKGGPGRDPYGNFQLNGFEVDAGGVPLAIKSIRADDANGGASVDTFFPKILPRDAYSPRGWRIDASREDKRLPRQIVFTLEQPLAMACRRRRVEVARPPAADSLEAPGRGRRAAARPVPVVRHVQQHAAACRGDLRPGCGRFSSWPRPSGPSEERSDLAAFYRTRRAVTEADARSDCGSAEEAQGARHPDGARDAGAGRPTSGPPRSCGAAAASWTRASRSTPACPRRSIRCPRTRCRTASAWRTGSSTRRTR